MFNRYLLATILVSLALTATSAQAGTLSGESISLGAATKVFYSRIVSAEKSGSGNGLEMIRRELGFDQETSRAYLAYVIASKDGGDRFVQDERSKLVCAKRKDMTYEKIGDGMAQVFADETSHWNDVARDSQKVLGAANQAKAENHILQTRTWLTISDIDPRQAAKASAERGTSVESIVSSLCDKTS